MRGETGRAKLDNVRRRASACGRCRGSRPNAADIAASAAPAIGLGARPVQRGRGAAPAITAGKARFSIETGSAGRRRRSPGAARRSGRPRYSDARGKRPYRRGKRARVRHCSCFSRGRSARWVDRLQLASRQEFAGKLEHLERPTLEGATRGRHFDSTCGRARWNRRRYLCGRNDFELRGLSIEPDDARFR
jgi:hypothetical protein